MLVLVLPGKAAGYARLGSVSMLVLVPLPLNDLFTYVVCRCTSLMGSHDRHHSNQALF